MRILITGAAGFIGSHLVRRLVHDGVHDVVAMDSLVEPSPAKRLTQGMFGRTPAPKWVLEDISNALIVIPREKPDAVINLAARPFIPFCEKNPDTAMLVNGMGAHWVARACTLGDVDRLVQVSTAAVYSRDRIRHSVTDPMEPCDIYGVTKMVGEKLVQQMCGVPDRDGPGYMSWMICRLFNVYGKDETHPFFLTVLRDAVQAGGEEVSLGRTDVGRDFIHVDDVVDALILAVESDKSGVVNIGTGIETPLEVALDVARRETGMPLDVIRLGSKIRKIDRDGMVADFSGLWMLDGWKPKREFRSTLGSYLAGEC